MIAKRPATKKPAQARAKTSEGKNHTLVTFLLDRTGSMSAVLYPTIQGFNTYLTGLQASKDKIDFSLVQFDSQGIDKLYVKVPVKDVEPRSILNYQPRGGTPLIDASWMTIKAVEESLSGQHRKYQPKIVICIQTDGQENSSIQHNWEELKALVAEKQALGWQFNFMGAGIDAYQQATQMGLQAGQTVAYALDSYSTANAFAAQAANTVDYTAGVKRDTTYSAGQKKLAGDVWEKTSKRKQPAGKAQAAPQAAPPSTRSALPREIKL